jgi:hypothetical protein
LSAESGGAKKHRSAEVKLKEQFIRKPHSAKIKIIVFKLSLKGLLETSALLFAGKVKHAVILAFMLFVERLSSTRGTHPLVTDVGESDIGD